jgi:tricorn protease
MFRRVVFAALLLFPALASSQIRLLRHPSYNKGRIAFSYLGDIWTAGEDGSAAQRITDNKARDVYPRFSPDGKWIAFSSNRDGNYDVYVVPADGGRPRQLTYHSANDNVVGWTPDSKQILFSSARGQGAFPTVATLYLISPEGGMEHPISTDWGANGSYSPDASKLAFVRHPSVWSRQHYRGEYAADLWVMDVAANKFTRLGDPDYKGNYFWPMYGHNGEIYFVADRTANEKTIKFAGPDVMKSVNNIWKISERGGAPVQVTHHTSGNLYFPSISADGRTIVYEENFGLWKLDIASGKSSEIKVNIRSDEKENAVELRTVRNEAESFHLSPSNKRAVIATHGELFTIATDKGEVQRVTESFWREQSPRWSPNGKWIAFISDRTGREEVWVSDELGKTTRKLSDVDCDKPAVVWAPDSLSLLWSGSDHKLRRVEVDSGKTDIIASSDVGAIGAPQFSPDGKWVSYSKQDNLIRPHVYVKQLETGTERMIGAEEFLESNGAKWTPDGKKLLLLGGAGVPSMASLNRTTSQLYSVALTRIDKGPEEGVDTEAEALAALDASGPGRGPARGAAPKVEVKIEWDGLDRRIKQLTSFGGSVSSVAPSPDSRTYAFWATGGGGGDQGGGGQGLYTIGEDGTRMTRLNTTVAADTAGAPPGRGGGGGFGGGNEPQWARDSRSIYYSQGRGIFTIPVAAAPAGESGAATPATGGGGGRGGRGGGGAAATAAATTATPGAGARRIAFTVHMEVDTAAERQQVFEEAWRVMKNRFYDAKMHGVNWAMAKDKYESLLPHVADVEELHDLIMEMIGEINASHTGISGGEPPDPTHEAAQTHYPGFDLEPDPSGYYKVSWIYKKGPADHDYVKIAKGNFIVSVNGKELKTTDNYWRLFNLLPGSRFDFMVNSAPKPEGAWAVPLEPLTQAAQGNLEYDRWVEARKITVAELSKGQIGYLHIKAMDAPSLAKFERDLMANLDKKALIIDERFNGGGGIDQELLAILNQRHKYESSQGRDSVVISRPSLAFFGPMAVLQNERSASDAEMFPEGFRALGLGKLIGVTTMGAVIGTGSFTLLDGSALRTPGSGVFGAKGQDLESYGVPPDVWVDNGPSDFLAGHDRQVEKAVEVLAAEIK